MEELIKITNLLKIPIEKIITFPQYVEIISANQNVGSLPYITIAKINTYDTSDGVLGKFRWNHIYSENADVINPLIYNLLEKEEEEIEITIGGYRNVYAKDNKGNLICGITCSYINDEWTINKIE
jgi:hypothetical protein